MSEPTPAGECCAPGCCDTSTPTIAVAAQTARPEQDPGQALRSTIRDRYAAAAHQAAAGTSACCGTTNLGKGRTWDPITSSLYPDGEASGVPEAALLASLGCGNPTALAELREGEVVLDLGSGGGIDVLLSARRVGPTGKAYGLDMTDAMLALARQNQYAAGVSNVEFLRGEIERIPLPSATVDVVISNCVINLSADKDAVLAEAFRVLRPGGRFAVSDIVLRGALPPSVRASVALWTGCVAGALHEDEYRALLGAIGFIDISIEPTRVYQASDVRALLDGAGLDDAALVSAVQGKVMSAFVRARRPV